MEVGAGIIHVQGSKNAERKKEVHKLDLRSSITNKSSSCEDCRESECKNCTSTAIIFKTPRTFSNMYVAISRDFNNLMFLGCFDSII